MLALEFFLGQRQLSGIDLARIEREYGVSLVEKSSASSRSAGWSRRMGGHNLRLSADD